MAEAHDRTALMRSGLLALGAFALLVTSCPQHEAQPPASATQPGEAPRADVQSAPGPVPNRIYSTALERARKEISADNAQKRLSEIERAIDREGVGSP